MPEFRHIPELVKVNGKWAFDQFVPTQPAFTYENYVGEKGTIYAVGCREFVKVGITKNFANRLKQIDYGVPFEVKTLATRTVPLAGLAYAEAWLHERFKAYRLKGEWFSAPQKDVVSAMALAVRRAEIYERYCRDWHMAEMKDRQTPERQEKVRKGYEEFLKRKVTEYT